MTEVAGAISAGTGHHEAGLHVEHQMRGPFEVDGFEQTEAAAPPQGNLNDIIFKLKFMYQLQ
ncbi:MAG: hypothetical protein B7Z41_01820 [Rhizobiales bacterium 12-66-7]|uniref:hypothetical protein n=1 Tax=Roseixanthobacter finlandensis TaxID=3119922 RepID=UPI000BD2F71C|nr:MAG: hypothetical protein B7Z41_01820 [Rhizobiales bacterium 12-66-7]HQS48479.1 hypothetical protein [Xanthobacteraceae bacterium]